MNTLLDGGAYLRDLRRTVAWRWRAVQHRFTAPPTECTRRMR